MKPNIPLALRRCPFCIHNDLCMKCDQDRINWPFFEPLESVRSALDEFYNAGAKDERKRIMDRLYHIYIPSFMNIHIGSLKNK